jgi:stage II sporulation protein Q
MKPEEPKNHVSDFEKAKRRLKWKKLFAKKWFFPAVYLTAAALILTIAWWYQENRMHQVSKTAKHTIDTLLPSEDPSNPTHDGMVLPVGNESSAKETIGFYDEASSKSDKEASLVNYANTYWPHSGMDFARKDRKTFDVVAVMDGKVMRVEENPVVGYLVEIEHDNGMTTVYQSLKDVQVTKGQMVKKGQVIAKAGRNTFEKEAGVHLHFEIRNKDHQAINPAQYLPHTK